MAIVKKDKIGIEKLKTGWVIRITICGTEYKVGRCKSKKLCQMLRDMIITKLNLRSTVVYKSFNEDQNAFMKRHSKKGFLRMVTEKRYIRFYNKFLRSRKKARGENQALNDGVTAAKTLPNSMDNVVPVEAEAATIATKSATAAEAATIATKSATAAEAFAAAATAAATAAQEAKLAAKAAKQAAKAAKLAADAAQAAFRDVAAGQSIDNAIVDPFGVGLKNKEGENNCFLNVVIQVFATLNKQFDKGQNKAVEPNVLRKSLSKLYADRGTFQEGEMDDASDALQALLDCLHRSSTSVCERNTCIAHSIFGLDISIPMTCAYCEFNCGLIKHTSFLNSVTAKSVGCTNGTFDKLLKIAGMVKLPCDKDKGGCGRKGYFHPIISKSPHTFITVLGWENSSESANKISATLATITREIDIGLIYGGVREGRKHLLVSVICYRHMHYVCFAYKYRHWAMYDDELVKIIGDWEDVLAMCQEKNLQPQILFFEAISA